MMSRSSLLARQLLAATKNSGAIILPVAPRGAIIEIEGEEEELVRF